MSSRQTPVFKGKQANPTSPPCETGSFFVVIATYNERDNIESLIRKILALEQGFHVLVVDDNSPDGTGHVVRALAVESARVRLLARPERLGYGSACIEGLNEALRLGARAVFTMDADHSHDPSDLPRLAERLEHSDVVTGSRYVKGGGVVNWSLGRKLLSLWANLYVRAILGLPYKDCTSGFRGYRREVLEKIPWESIHSTGYAFLVELLHAAVQNGHSVSEVPITYTERRAGQSKMSRRVIWEAVRRPWVLRRRYVPSEPPQAVPVEPSSAMPRWVTWAVLVAILILATFLRFHVLAQDPFWVDEIITARTTQRASWSLVFASIRDEYAAETPAQIVIATVLYRLFGRSVWFYRSTSAVAGVLGVLGVFLLGRSLRNARLGLLAAFLFAIMPYNIRYSQEFRAYAALACFSGFTAWAFVRAVSAGRLRDWVFFGCVAAVSLYFHYFVGFVILAAGAYSFLASLWSLLEKQKRERLMFFFFCLASAVTLAVFSPWMVYVHNKPLRFQSNPVFRLDFVWATLSQLAGSNIQDGATVNSTFVLFWTLVALGVVASFALIGRLTLFFLFWIATTPFVFWLISLTGYFFSPRQFVYLQPLLCVLAMLPGEWICTRCRRTAKKHAPWILQGATIGVFALALAVPYGFQIAHYYVVGSVNKFQPIDDIGYFLAKNVPKNDVVVFDWEPYILEYHCGRSDVQPWSELPKVVGKGKAVWTVHTGLASQNDPFVTAHPPSVRINCVSNCAISYYSTATSFSLPAFLTGLALSKRGGEAGAIGALWQQVSPKAARAFYESVKTTSMNRRTRADFYICYGNSNRGRFFVTGDKDALQKAVLYLGKAVRYNPYNPHHYTYYADALLYAGELRESCRVALRGVKRSTDADICYPASVGIRAAQNLSDSRLFFEFGALLIKYQKDPKAWQSYVRQCRNYLRRHPEAADLCSEILKRHGLDPKDIME